MTNEAGQTDGIDAGVASNPQVGIAPNVNVHTQRDFKLTYQRSINSWRMGLSFEPCELVPFAPIPHSTLAPGGWRCK